VDDPARNAVAERTCPQCGIPADAGLIFCAKCGTALRTPAPLIESGNSSSSGQLFAEPKHKRTVLKWSLVATALVFGYFAWQCGSGMSTGARLSDDAVRHFHSQLDSGAYDNIVGESDEAFQNSDSHEELLKFLAGVHSKLGTSRGFTRTNILVNANTNGTFIRVSYASTFEQGNAVEVFTWRKVGGGLKLMGYHVESKTFFTH
jgi:hypothetical protein